MSTIKLVRTMFLGRSVKCIASFAEKLRKTEVRLRSEYDLAMIEVAPDFRPSFQEWHGVYSIGGYREGGSMHGRGRALDLNYPTNGYGASRTVRKSGRVVYGGEAAGRKLSGVREDFIAAVTYACDQAGVPCDLSARKEGESTGSVWDRWNTVSCAVRAILAPYYPAVDNYDAGDDDELPGVIIPEQIRKVYRKIRVVQVVGTPSVNPRLTRNPAKSGIMDLQRHTVVALADECGLRWGPADFGAAEAGDPQHFDDASRILSGA